MSRLQESQVWTELKELGLSLFLITPDLATMHKTFAAGRCEAPAEPHDTRRNLRSLCLDDHRTGLADTSDARLEKQIIGRCQMFAMHHIERLLDIRCCEVQSLWNDAVLCRQQVTPRFHTTRHRCPYFPCNS